MKHVWLMFGAAITLSVAISGRAEVLLQDDFSGSTLNASKWNVIKRPSSEVLLTESGELEVRMTQGIYVQEGVVSVQSFPVLAGERLVVGFYGTNSSGWTTGYDSQVCRPYWMVSPVNRNGSEYIDAQYMSHARIIGGAEYAVGDRVNYKNSGLPNGYVVGNFTYGAYKHCIITVDRANVNFYISDTAYDRSMTPLYTVATSSVFTPAELDSGLFVYLLNERYDAGGISNYERFDGVQVSSEPCSYVPRSVPVLLQSEMADGNLPTSQEYKDYVISQLAPVADILQLYYYTFGREETQAWIDTAHRYGMMIALSLGPVPGPTPSRGVGPAHLVAPSPQSIRPQDGILCEYDTPDFGDVVAVDQWAQNLRGVLAQLHDLDYFFFDEFQLPRILPEPFDGWQADAPYFAAVTFSDASLADFRSFVGDPSVKFPALSEDSVLVDANPAKFAVRDSGDALWNKFWSWRFDITRRSAETLAAAVHHEMEEQENVRFNGVILFTSNRWCYDTAYNAQHIRFKSNGVAIDDVSLPGAPGVPGMASSPHIDILISEDGMDQATIGPSESIQYFRAAAMKYGKIWGNFLELWSYPNAALTDPSILTQALEITTGYGSQMVAAYENGVFVSDPGYNPFNNYGPDQVAWWQEHVAPRTYATVHGTLVLDRYRGDNATVRATFAFEPTGGGVNTTRIAFLDADGAFCLDHIPTGTYRLYVRAPGWLETIVDDVTVLSESTVLAAPIALRGGDANGDNAVTFEDFAILQNSYGQRGASAADALSAAAAVGGCGLPGMAILSLAGFAIVTLGWRFRE